jgi:predicted extracellular nuclease
MLKTVSFINFLFLSSLFIEAQKVTTLSTLAFYNTENLFDTIHDAGKQDSDFLPGGPYHYSSAVYTEKIAHIAEVIYSLSTEITSSHLAVMGLAEVENNRVLDDLITQPAIDSFHYQYVHIESPDERGIDVALLYNPACFKVLSSSALTVNLYNDNGSLRPTRDILWVYGRLEDKPVHILVNHWPSRRGGQAASSKYRAIAANICRHFIDSINRADALAQIIVMGDLNDDPTDSSIALILNARCDTTGLKTGDLFNPWCAPYTQGFGSIEYDDKWNLFDQIICSYNFVNTPAGHLHLLESHIFNKDFLITHTGKYKGYPHRTYSGKYYIHGYSDHFPVYAVLGVK